jgi:hypothetical protein
MRFAPAIELRRRGRRRARLAVQRRRLAFLHEAAANAIDGVHVHAQCFTDLPSRHVTIGTIAITQQEDLGMSNLACRGIAVTGNLIQSLTLLAGENDGILVWC